MKVGKHCSQEHGIVKEVGGVCVFLNGNIAIEMDTFERPELDVHGYKQEVEVFYMDLDKFYRKDHTFCKKLLIRQCGAARAAGNQELTSEFARLCREPVKEDIEMGKVEVLAEAAEEKESIRRAVQ
ncbi:hypothetical protein RB195_020352 [Necator americanus]|uniref:Uncharacterized protein n=1 Tax=Necator americanus TaxID=51031 RepID=A0ABR1CM08_NECAM